MLKLNNSWVCYGNSNIGKSHINNGIPCQDSISYLCNSKCLVAVLCDGLGSKEHSDKGAMYVSSLVRELFRKKDFFYYYKMEEKQLAEVLIDIIKKNIKKDKNINKYDLDSLKTTLLFIAIRGNHYIIGHVGDGVLCLLNNDDIYYYSSAKKNAGELEYANTTFTIFDEDAKEHFLIKKGEINNQFNGALLLSDGLPFLAHSNKIAPKVATYLDMIRNSSLSFIENTINDNIRRIVESKESCTDDWSYVFAARKSHSKAKKFYNYK